MGIGSVAAASCVSSLGSCHILVIVNQSGSRGCCVNQSVIFPRVFVYW